MQQPTRICAQQGRETCPPHHWLIEPDPSRPTWDRWTCSRCGVTRSVDRKPARFFRPSRASTWTVEDLAIAGYLDEDGDALVR